MSKGAPFQDLSLPMPGSDQERWRWLYHELRTAIVDGRLKRGSKLPSSRSLAEQYDLSRGTVVTAFQQLRLEGYIRGVTGAGTYVATGLPEPPSALLQKHAVPQSLRSSASLPQNVQKIYGASTVMPGSRSIGKAFRAHEPAIDLFPVELWARIASRVLRKAPRALYGQGDAAGYLPLRRAIAEYIGSSRGVHCRPEQIIVTSGAQQALDLIARLLIEPQSPIWMEDPGYPGAVRAFQAAGAKIVPVPVDDQGLNVKEGRKALGKANLAYVTPSCQFPLGVTMSADRRLELLAWASEVGAWIVEDEFDAEYRYFGRPVPALQSVDQSGSVIYVGTFTKMLFNAIRIGFVIVPERIVDAFVAAKSYLDRHSPTLDQAILAEFITEGHFGQHVRKMRQVYAERLTVLREESRRILGNRLEVANAATGMRTVAWLKGHLSEASVVQRARGLGLELSGLSVYTMQHTPAPGLMLGFAGCNPRELRRGISALASALE
jgi:GntR family transcriptional regulator / MocR family aminotransferase